MSITLLCFVKGNTLANAFPVDVEKDQLVGRLKKVIKAAKQNKFTSVDADKFRTTEGRTPCKKRYRLLDREPPKRHIRKVATLEEALSSRKQECFYGGFFRGSESIPLRPTTDIQRPRFNDRFVVLNEEVLRNSMNVNI
uniref:Crinkler effector protein N-terminal domain-containing protein n=1 Tax=Rhizophagus irregularis (strain DAOM 181602 / DAOM 197198 / MUCL 43194) TaxID=747089 RepID=U9UCN8_RHIID